MRKSALEQVQVFVTAVTIGILAAVSAALAVAEAEAGQLWPTLICLAAFATCSVVAARVAGKQWVRTRNTIATLFSAGTFVVVFMIAATRAQAVDRFWLAGFGIAMWIVCLTIIYDRFFAKEPRPSRYAE